MNSLNGVTHLDHPGDRNYQHIHLHNHFQDHYRDSRGQPSFDANLAIRNDADFADEETPVRLARDPARHIISRAGRDNSLAISGEKPRYEPLSHTTERVLRMLLACDFSRIRAESVAEALGVSCTTLRRRLREDHTSYQFLLDRARQFRCEARLKERWLPGKCLADELGYLEINSFYRAFKRWTGLNYSEYRDVFCCAT